MRNLDRYKEKAKNLEKKFKEKKENLKQKIKTKRDKLINSKRTDKNLMPAMFEMLFIIVNRGRGQAVLNYLKSIDVSVNIVSFGEGTAPSNIASLLGYSQEKEIIFSVVNVKDSEKILDLLDSIFLSTEKSAGIAFTIPLKSMTSFSLEQFENYNTFQNGGK